MTIFDAGKLENPVPAHLLAAISILERAPRADTSHLRQGILPLVGSAKGHPKPPLTMPPRQFGASVE
ncbi:hypothetical protein [Novosphingobium resinovorum]|uniref:hypothetical protein n=1 Tax=Novosphingobium resinovorum TaxID=158500 RepID=UPI0012EAAD29|nr:hypothetical protein [Novosphingobium resinovorum]